MENKELIDIILTNLFREYEPVEAATHTQLSKKELVNKLLIADATLQMLKEKIKVLEWENHIWNSSDRFKIPGHTL